MTLIVSAHVDRGRIVQASDCRASFAPGRYSDTNVKTVVVYCNDGLFVMGYTGLGHVGPDEQPTDRWVVETLQDCRREWIELTVSERAARASSLQLGGGQDDALTFAGAGFRGDASAFAFTVSNVIGEDGRSLPTVSGEFVVHVAERGGFLAYNGMSTQRPKRLKHCWPT